MKKLLIAAAAAAVLALLYFGMRQPDKAGQVAVVSPSAGNQSSRTVGQSPLEAAQAEMQKLQQLRTLSSNNVPFQTWGRNLMLAKVNSHLAKVPVFGLTGPLNESNSIVHSFLTPDGAELWLHTKDLKHRFRYTHGVLLEALASEADITGIGRDPEKLNRFAENAGPWTTDAAREAAEAAIDKSGLNRKALGLGRAPVIRPETLRLPGSSAEITPFYTAAWIGAQDELILEIRFRRTATGTWEPTYWFNNSRRTEDTESTSYSNLFARFF